MIAHVGIVHEIPETLCVAALEAHAKYSQRRVIDGGVCLDSTGTVRAYLEFDGNRQSWRLVRK